jgi:hypothetical protein
VKAGRGIPLKWELYDLGGNPITDLAPSTVSLTSVGIACATLTEDVNVIDCCRSPFLVIPRSLHLG